MSQKVLGTSVIAEFAPRDEFSLWLPLWPGPRITKWVSFYNGTNFLCAYLYDKGQETLGVYQDIEPNKFSLNEFPSIVKR